MYVGHCEASILVSFDGALSLCQKGVLGSVLDEGGGSVLDFGGDAMKELHSLDIENIHSNRHLSVIFQYKGVHWFHFHFLCWGWWSPCGLPFDERCLLPVDRHCSFRVFNADRAIHDQVVL